MTIFLLTFLVLLLVVTGMAVGIIFANKPIKGSCGGLAALGIDPSCDICGGDTRKCEEEQERQAELKEAGSEAKDLAYDATNKSNR